MSDKDPLNKELKFQGKFTTNYKMILHAQAIECPFGFNQ